MRRFFSLVAFMLGLLTMSSMIVASEAKAEDGSAVVVADESPPAIIVQAITTEIPRDGTAESDAFEQLTITYSATNERVRFDQRAFISPPTYSIPKISYAGEAATGGSLVSPLESRRIPVSAHPPSRRLSVCQ